MEESSGQIEGTVGPLAVITGAASGVGLATVRALTAVGTDVLGVDRSPPPAELATVGVDWVQGDVSDDATWNRTGERIAELDPAGAGSLICCAGDVSVGAFTEMPVEEWKRLLDINLLGVIRAMHTVLPAMIDRGEGVIAVVCSVNSFTAEAGGSAYSTSKAALLHAVRSAAIELAPAGVRVNAVCPGCVDTPLLRKHLEATGEPDRFRRALERRTPTGKLITPEEVAQALCFLISPNASGLVGASVVVDDGLTVTYDFDHDAAT